MSLNPFHIENRWKVDWTRTPSGWKTWMNCGWYQNYS